MKKVLSIFLALTLLCSLSLGAAYAEPVSWLEPGIALTQRLSSPHRMVFNFTVDMEQLLQLEEILAMEDQLDEATLAMVKTYELGLFALSSALTFETQVYPDSFRNIFYLNGAVLSEGYYFEQDDQLILNSSLAPSYLLPLSELEEMEDFPSEAAWAAAAQQVNAFRDYDPLAELYSVLSQLADFLGQKGLLAKDDDSLILSLPWYAFEEIMQDFEPSLSPAMMQLLSLADQEETAPADIEPDSQPASPVSSGISSSFAEDDDEEEDEDEDDEFDSEPTALVSAFTAIAENAEMDEALEELLDMLMAAGTEDDFLPEHPLMLRFAVSGDQITLEKYVEAETERTKAETDSAIASAIARTERVLARQGALLSCSPRQLLIRLSAADQTGVELSLNCQNPASVEGTIANILQSGRDAFQFTLTKDDTHQEFNLSYQPNNALSPEEKAMKLSFNGMMMPDVPPARVSLRWANDLSTLDGEFFYQQQDTWHKLLGLHFACDPLEMPYDIPSMDGKVLLPSDGTGTADLRYLGEFHDTGIRHLNKTLLTNLPAEARPYLSPLLLLTGSLMESGVPILECFPFFLLPCLPLYRGLPTDLDIDF